MTAEIIGIGVRLMQPDALEASARLVARELENCDIQMAHAAAALDVSQLRRAIATALGRSDIVILLGGLSAGPEGFAMETVCQGLGKRLVLHEESLRRIREAYRRAGRQMPQQVTKLAMLPEQSMVFPGVRGITPGCALSAGRQYIVLLPEPSKEFVPMLQNSVIPYFTQYSEAAAVTRTVNVYGLDERHTLEKLGELLGTQNPAVAVLPKGLEVQVRISASAKTRREANALCLPMVQRVMNTLGTAAYGIDQKNLPSYVTGQLGEQGMTLSVGEGNTGGLLADWLSVQGAVTLLFSARADSDREKQERLNVPAKRLKKYGGVSAAVAAALAFGALEQGGSTLGIGVTVETDDSKRAGTAFAAFCDAGQVWVRKLTLPKGTPPDIMRQTACMAALDLARQYLKALPGKPEGGTARKAALAGKITPLVPATESKRTGKPAPAEKQSFFAKIFPAKGDGGADVMRKLILLMAVAIFAVSIGYLINFQFAGSRNRTLQSDLESMYVEGMTEEEMTTLDIPDNYPKGYQKKFANLYRRNEDIAGWLKIPGTTVNYPVVHYTDNDYYMRRDFSGKSSKYGTPWLDMDNTMDTQSANYIIYGHNMTDGQMFGELMNYKGQNGLDYLKEHPVIAFDDVYRDNTYQIISVFITNAKPQYGELFPYHEMTDFDSDAEFNTFVSEVRERSYYDSDIDVKPGDHLLTLSTCSYEFGPVAEDSHVRTVVVARKLRMGEKQDGSSYSYQQNPDYKLPPGFRTGEQVVQTAAATTQSPSSAPSAAQMLAQGDGGASSRAAAEKAASEAAASKAAAEKAASEAAASKAAADKAASEAAASKAAADKAASEAAASKAAADKAASEAAASKAAAEKAASEAAASKAAASKAAEEKRLQKEEEERRRLEEEDARLEEEARREEEEAENDREPSGSASDKLTIIAGGKKVNGKASEIVPKVVMNEMGPGFHDEALKAQAVAAYTFIKQQNASGVTPYLGMKTASGSVIDAVDEVLGEAVYYKSNLAFTPFYATSAGVTISSKDVWGGSYAYLVPVDSEIDEYARNFEISVTMSADEVAKRAQNAFRVDLWDFSDDPEDWFDIRSYTEGDRYIKEIDVGDKSTTGRIVREQMLNLRSAAFDIDYDSRGEQFTFTTYGYGHGVGMSQTGANLYAVEEGWDYEDILTHYYPGCKVQ